MGIWIARDHEKISGAIMTNPACFTADCNGEAHLHKVYLKEYPHLPGKLPDVVYVFKCELCGRLKQYSEFNLHLIGYFESVEYQTAREGVDYLVEKSEK